MILSVLQKNMRAIALSSCALAAMTCYAQDGVTTIECENPSEKSYVEIDERTGCSGQSGLCFHSWKGGYANYEFEAPKAGTYDLTIYYVTTEERWFSVKVNDQAMKAVCCSETTPNWDGEPVLDDVTGEVITPGVLSKTLKVYMQEGSNIIQMQGLFKYYANDATNLEKPYSPILDKIEIKYSDTQLGEVADGPEQILRECEDYSSIIGSAFTKNMGAFSGGAGVNLNKADGGFTYNVNVATAGVYKLDIYYTYMAERWISVKVGDTKRMNVQFKTRTETWEGTGTSKPEEYPAFFQRSVLIWLEAGDNVITFSSYTTPGTNYADSPSMDKFTLDLIECSEFVKPTYDILAKKVSLADIATFTANEEIDVTKLNDHNEHTGVTLSGKTALTVTAELPYAFKITGYSYSTSNNNEDWTVEISADGNDWSEISAGSSKEGTIYTYSMSEPSAAAKYVRVVASGTEDVNLNEIQLYGNPCVSETQNFPEGIFKADYITLDYNNEGFPSWNQKPENLFNDVLNDLYAFSKGSEDVYVTVSLDDVKATSYMISVSELYHHPKNWEIWGHDCESDEWVLLDEQANIEFIAAKGSTLFFPIADPKTCYEYKIVFKDKDGELSKWQMFTEEQSVVTDICSIKADDQTMVDIAVSNGKLTLSSDKAANYNVYSLQGVNVATGVVLGTSNVSLPTGIYLVKVGNKVIKAAVK